MAELSVSSPEIYEFRIVLCAISPLVWRRLLVESQSSLAELHYALQVIFDWSNESLHRFRIHGKDYGIPQGAGMVFHEDARRVPLSRFRLRCGERFRYEYDFTADWKLDLRLEKVLPFDPGRPLPVCTAGRRSAPPEDCCGARDYLERLDRHRYPFEDMAVIAEATGVSSSNASQCCQSDRSKVALNRPGKGAPNPNTVQQIATKASACLRPTLRTSRPDISADWG